MNGDNPIYALATWIIPLVIAITFHEAAHGLVASAFGDPTAKDAGRLTLNPLRHVDPMGTLVLPMTLAIVGAPVLGWAKPVPVRPDLLRNPRWHGILVTAAGPAMNFLLAIVGAALFAIAMELAPAGPRGTGLLFLLVNIQNFILVNLFLGVFNLLPIPPLDGGHVVAGLLPPALGKRFARVGRFGFALLLFLLVALPMFMPSADVIGKLVYPPVHAMANGLFNLFVVR
ncbi:MAG: site-2 protease family protein [Rhizorhabdus sp.]|nr:site-2 protease family protein [Rhizorhabdus sp.]